MRAMFIRYEKITPEMTTLWFKPLDPMPYQAGQFTEIQLPHESPDDRGSKRWFTLSSSPTEPLIAITTRLNEPDGSSFKKTLSQLQSGAEILMAQPMGDFVLPKPPEIPLVFVSAGIGITPVRSMVKWLLDSHEKRRVHIIHKPRGLEDLPYKELFDAYGARVNIVAEKLSVKRINKFLNGSPVGLIYLSGPEKMVEKLKDELQLSGVASSKLVTDYFHGYD